MGKGDTQRPAQVDYRELARRWCATFGHRPATPEGHLGFWRCLQCGAQGELPAPAGQP